MERGTKTSKRTENNWFYLVGNSIPTNKKHPSRHQAQNKVSVSTYWSTIAEYHEKKKKINTIGTGLKTLFGTLDDDDAEYFNEKISNTDSNQHRVYQLEKYQLAVVRNTI